jgi:endonuclease/exonuclease/phosphatase family metal-dependent hydrolase
VTDLTSLTSIRSVTARAGLGATLLLASGCAAHVAMRPLPSLAACRQPLQAPGSEAPIRIDWILPAPEADRLALDDWCRTVGPAVVAGAPGGEDATDRLAVVTWNMHVGGGDLSRLVTHLREGRLSGGRPVRHFVVLVQEALRAGPSVPALVPAVAPVPGRIAPRPPAGRRSHDIVAEAGALELWLYYAPSMRNGRSKAEDRGNAILSTLPLSDFEAIELPFEGQRRVAVAATVAGRRADGSPWRLRVTSAHLDSRSGPRRLWWLFAPAGRSRQARGLIEALPADTPAVLGGDLNTWLGVSEHSYQQLLDVFTDTPVTPGLPTLRGIGLRLDHLFFRLPESWKASYARLGDAYGSDHYPLVGWIALDR